MTFLWVAILIIGSGAIFSIMQNIANDPAQKEYSEQEWAEYSDIELEAFQAKENEQSIENSFGEGNGNTNEGIIKSGTTLSSSGSGGGGGGGGGSSSDNSCIPQCSGKTCGDDGCGGVCGNCDDSVTCTVDSCGDGSCIYTPDNALCDDSQECTIDICDALTGCSNDIAPNGTICSTGTCQGGECVECTQDSDCDDGVSCTVDSCNSGICSNTPDNNMCSESQVCDSVYGCVSEITIDDDWLNASGESPYLLESEGATYNLATDITTNTTAFVMTANNIKFNLNGHTITYCDFEPPYIENEDFEQGNGTNVPGWDFSNAPNADVSLDRFSHMEEYANLQSLRFDVPAPDQYVRSQEPVQLEPNTYYSLIMHIHSGVFRRGGNNSNRPNVYVELEGGGHIMSTDRGTNRGYRFERYKFVTGNTSENNHIRVGISNANNSDISDDYIYVEYVAIKESACHGVLMGTKSYRVEQYYPEMEDLAKHGGGESGEVFNGTIIQGKGGSEYSNGVTGSSPQYPASTTKAYNLNISVHGPNSINIDSIGQVYNNHLTSSVKHITSRDAFDGIIIQRGRQIYNNTLIGGVQGGILPSNPANVYNNYISIRSSYTNGFGIMGYGNDDSNYYNNTIDCTKGDHACRGIFIGGGSKSINTHIYNNTILIQETGKRNQEYNGCQGGILSGGYGIQVESSINSTIYGNTVTAISRSGECASHAFRMNVKSSDVGIEVYNNTFIAKRYQSDTSSFHPVSTSLKIDSATNATVLFTNNKIVTNHRWLHATSMTGVKFIGNEFLVDSENRESPHEPLIRNHYRAHQKNLTDIEFIDNTYPDATTETFFESQKLQRKFYSDYGTDQESSFYYSWSYDLRVTDSSNNSLSGATVELENQFGTVVYSGTTDAQGKIPTQILREYYQAGENRTEYNPYTLTVSLGGYNPYSEDLTIDTKRSMTVNLEDGFSVGSVEEEGESGLFSALGEVFSKVIENVVEFMTPVGEAQEEEETSEGVQEEEEKVPLTGNENKQESTPNPADEEEEENVEEVEEGEETSQENVEEPIEEGVQEEEESEETQEQGTTSEIPQDYISYFKFEENTNDEGGVFTNARPVSDPIYTNGKVGKALDANEGGYVKLGSPEGYPELFDLDNGFTLSFWMYTHSVRNNTYGVSRLIYQYSGGEWITYRIRKGSDQKYSLQGVLRHSGTHTSVATTKMEEFEFLDKWVHATWTYDGLKSKLFINGILVDQSNSGGVFLKNLNIGTIAAPTSGSFDGIMDEVLFYDRGLSEEEVNNVYCALGGECE